MLSEAAAAGVPVHVFRLAGRRGKFARLEKALARAGIVQSWVVDVPPPPAPVDEARRLAAIIRRRAGVQNGARSR